MSKDTALSEMELISCLKDGLKLWKPIMITLTEKFVLLSFKINLEFS